MDDHDTQEAQERQEPVKYPADDAGRSWLQALYAARMNTERKREADAMLREAWGIKQEQE